MSVFWNTNAGRAAEATGAAQRSEQKAEDAMFHLRRLEGRVNQLTLVNMALWSLLKEKARLTEEDLVQRVQEIDLRDGKLDGQLTELTVNCPNCGRVLSKKHDRCLYCGFEPAGYDAFGFPVWETT